MVRWLGILFGTLRSTVRTHRELALENLALRQQLAVWKVRQPRPRLTAMDRIFPTGGAAWDRGGMAPAGVQALLGVEESTPTWSARDRNGAPKPDSADEPRQSSLERAADPWRAAEAGPDR